MFMRSFIFEMDRAIRILLYIAPFNLSPCALMVHEVTKMSNVNATFLPSAVNDVVSFASAFVSCVNYFNKLPLASGI